MTSHLVIIAVMLPLAGFLLNGLFGARVKREGPIGALGSGTVGVGFLIAVYLFAHLLGRPVEDRTISVTLYEWISAGAFTSSVSYVIDPLSVTMMLIVTGVGFLIHVYSIGYMHGDPGFARFFSYLNLFIFAMLNLILADNFLLLFLGWEGVGLCSYLLIGFWFEKKFNGGTTGDAAKKAFVVNRIGDVGFLLGIFLVFVTFGTIEFRSVFTQAASFEVGSTVLVLITLALFVGATGKSAQIPLYIWLPDAMAGPTPVSALIHAATMVTAGVYMVARCSILYALAPFTMEVVAVIGAATAIFAATIGLVQNDIKKVLAYSTISQLGYMFLALGVGAFAAGIFHVLTHAFFKALLFLGSGAVIHAMHEEQNIQKMGGLKSHLPVTYWTFLIGAIAIAGIPPLSGFFSKDEILWKVFDSGQWGLWLIGVGGAALTAFYVFRLVSLTFEGEARWGPEVHPHEAPRTMTVPLILLAVLSIVGGFVGVPASLGGGNAIEHWLEPVFAPAQEKLTHPAHATDPTEYLLMGLSVAVAMGGMFLARYFYLKRKDLPERMSRKASLAYKILFDKYYVDEMYDATVVNPIVKGSERLLWRGIDIGIIDWLVNATGRFFTWASSTVRVVQTGVTETYIFIFLLGVVAAIAWLLAG
jgi:NADH-quinone oxidoreductase subunit L